VGYRIVKTPQPGAYDIPFIGEHLAKIGHAVDIWNTPCTPTVEIWVYALWQAIPTAYISLVKPDDWGFEIIHHGGRAGKGKHWVFKVLNPFPENYINVRVPAWRVFKLNALINRVQYFSLVADIIEQGAINWMTLAYKSEGCTTENLEYLNASQHHQLNGSSSGPGQTVLVWGTDAESRISWDSQQCIIRFPGKYRIGWSIYFTPYEVPGLGEVPIGTYVFVDGQPYDVGEMAYGEDGTKFTSGSFMIDHDGGSPNPKITIVAHWADGTGYCWGEGTFTVYNTGNNDLEPDP
jgi:hypothetical protein